jgi:hypothetical protein
MNMSAQIAPSNANVISRAPSERVIKFQKWFDEVRNLLDSKDPAKQKLALAANQDFIKGLARPGFSADGTVAKAVAPAAVHVDTLMSNFSLMYANEEYVGERLMPVVNVAKRSDKFASYPKRERFAFPDDEMGTRSSPNELTETRTTDNYSVKDYGLKNFLDLETAVNEDAPLNEMLDLLEAPNEGLAFKREKRISTIVVTSGNYGGNTGAITSTNWNDSTGGTIIGDIQNAVSSVWRGQTPTKLVGVCPIGVWNSGIFNNPALAERFKYTAGGPTLVQQVANFFGLDELYVCKAREDTANDGQTASYARIWSTDVFAVLAVAMRPTLRSLHFGSTFRMNGTPITTEWTDPSLGVRGGLWAKVAVSEDHKVCAGDAGYLITGVLT